jgi:hypothetical protein
LMEMELSYRRFRVKGSIYTRCEAVTVSWPSRVSGVDNTELNKVSSRDLCVANMVAEIEGRATSWWRMTVTMMTMGLNGLNNRPWWGGKREKLGVLRFTLVIASQRSVANCFDRSWAYFLVRFWEFEG